MAGNASVRGIYQFTWSSFLDGVSTILSYCLRRNIRAVPLVDAFQTHWLGISNRAIVVDISQLL